MMGKFLIGVIVGAFLGILALTVSPNLPQELRVALASLTSMVMRGAEEAAESVGDAADELADEAGRATDAARGRAREAGEDAPQ
jgi:gas vesicle protein